MVSRLFRVLDTRVEGLHRAAYVLALFALGSHILALVRDRLLAHTFGAGMTLDIYYAAFRIPDLIFVSVASMVSLFVLIPFLLERDTTEERRAFISTVFSGFIIVIAVVSALAFVLAPSLVKVFFPGLSAGSAVETLILLTRIMLLSPILLGVSNIFTSVIQLSKRFFVFALSPVLYNLGIIFGIVLLYPSFGISGLAYGVVLGALLHMGLQIPFVSRARLLPRFVPSPGWKILKRVALISLPRTFTLAVNQVVLLLLIGVASLMNEGSISIFNLGFNLQGVPLALIGVSYSVAAFPMLAELFTQGKRSEFFDQMVTAIRHVIFWSFPATVLFIVLRAQIVRTILGSGSFDWVDTRLTAAVLALFVVSLVAQSLEMLFVRGYYASGRTWKPLVIKVVVLFITATIALVGVELFRTNEIIKHFFESLLRISSIQGGSVVMLALAYSVGIIVSSIIFWVVFRRDFGTALPRSIYKALWNSFSSSVVGGAAAYGVLLVLGTQLNLDTFFGIFTQGLVAGIVGILVWATTLKMLKSEEFTSAWSAAHKKLRDLLATSAEEHRDGS